MQFQLLCKEFHKNNKDANKSPIEPSYEQIFAILLFGNIMCTFKSLRIRNCVSNFQASTGLDRANVTESEETDPHLNCSMFWRRGSPRHMLHSPSPRGTNDIFRLKLAKLLPKYDLVIGPYSCHRSGMACSILIGILTPFRWLRSLFVVDSS